MNIVFFGECMIELSGSPVHRRYGGDTLNTALYLARLTKGSALNVSFATAMGKDKLSQEIIDDWISEGITCKLVSQFDNKMPGLYLVETDQLGERSFYYWRSDSAAKSYFKSAQNPLEKDIQNIDYIYLSGISLAILDDKSQSKLLSLLKTLKENGGKVIFDNNYRAQLWSAAKAKQCYQSILQLTDIALLTEDDEQSIYKDDNYQQILDRCHQYEIDEVIIKRGIKPCVISYCGNKIEVPAEKVNQVVDTCAAGDSFAAGYLSERLFGKSVEMSAQVGHKLAARVIQYAGAIIPIEAMPSI